MLLQKENESLFSLNDPCHSLNLIVKNSLETLPKEVLEFIDGIHSHFKSPQRRAVLARIQRENNLEVLSLKPYIKTRWLSLGNSLQRLINIWESLVLYTECLNKEKPKMRPKSYDNQLQALDSKVMNSLLRDPAFYAKIVYIYSMIKEINNTNERLQGHSLSITTLKPKVMECYNFLLSMIVRPEKLDFSTREFISINWNDVTLRNEWFLDSEDLFNYLLNEFSLQSFKVLKVLSPKQKEDVYTTIAEFMAKVLTLFPKKINLNHKLFNLVDCIEMEGDYQITKDKFLELGKYFNVIDETNLEKFQKEIIKVLSNHRLKEFKRLAGGDTLKLWDLIGFKELELLQKLIVVVHSLPTTSASIEQSFSIMKLYKTEKRNRLQESTLESLMLIDDRYKGQKDIIISQSMIESYDEVRKILNERKII